MCAFVRVMVPYSFWRRGEMVMCAVFGSMFCYSLGS